MAKFSSHKSRRTGMRHSISRGAGARSAMSGAFKKAATTTASGARSITTRTASGSRSAATTAVSRSKSLETIAKNAFNVTAHKAVNPDTSSILRDVTAAMEALANARLARIPDDADWTDTTSRLGMQPFDHELFSLDGKSLIDLRPHYRVSGFEGSLLAGLAEGRGADEIAEELGMDASAVRESIATRLRVMPPSVDVDELKGKHYVLPRKALVFGQVTPDEEVDQFASIVSRFNEPTTKRAAAENGPAPAVVVPPVMKYGKSREGAQRPEETKVPTRSGRPIHPDTQRKLAQIYVDAHERAGMPVPEDVRKLAAGA